MSKKVTVAVALFAALISMTSPAWSQENAGLKRIRIGMPNRGATTLGLTAAQSQGFLRAQGLYAELIVMRPSSSLQTLIAGDLDFSDRPCVRRARQRERASASYRDDSDRRPRFYLGCATRDPARGRSQRENARGIWYWRVYRHRRAHGAQKIRLDAGRRRENTRPVRQPSFATSALQAGQIDGTVMAMPFNKMAVKMGFREIVQLREIIKTPQGGLVTTLQKIRGEPEIIVRTIKAALWAIVF